MNYYKIINEEIKKRLENEEWENKIAKSVYKKLLYEKYKFFLRIAVIFLFLSILSLSYWDYQKSKEEEQWEILINYYYEYQPQQFIEVISYYE